MPYARPWRGPPQVGQAGAPMSMGEPQEVGHVRPRPVDRHEDPVVRPGRQDLVAETEIVVHERDSGSFVPRPHGRRTGPMRRGRGEPGEEVPRGRDRVQRRVEQSERNVCLRPRSSPDGRERRSLRVSFLTS
jgi:hypothetical protein